MATTIEISGVWLRAYTDQSGRERIFVDVEINGQMVNVIAEDGGRVHSQDCGANISHFKSVTAVLRELPGVGQ